MSTDWQPSAKLDTLRQRAIVMAQLRQFFADRGVLEVETPLLCQHGVTDPHMDLMVSQPVSDVSSYYLQSSPEYAMKRLLASGSGPIYQLCKAFRRGEKSRRHNPEFSLLEWYRPGFDHYQLMDEISNLLEVLISAKPALQVSYASLFLSFFSVDPHSASCETLETITRKHLDVQMDSDNVDDWLNLLMAEVIEPKLGFDGPIFIVDYPASQAALAKLAYSDDGVQIAQRFELYVQGIELANGYYELTDSDEQRQRFEQEQVLRKKLARPTMASDQYLQAAMDSGLPECAGVALGFDRLMMLALKASSIDDVISFGIDRA